MNPFHSLLIAGLLCTTAASAQRSETLLKTLWQFHRGEALGAEAAEYNSKAWQAVSIPHDWAITGPFSRNNDLQRVAVTQNGETEASEKTGRTGGLPYAGVGWYRTTFAADTAGRTTLLFDGAMSEAQVFVNGQKAAFWPYGYNSFFVDITPYLNPNGQANVLTVRLENRPQSARWYPGAGLYRNVRLIHTNRIHVPVWGTQVLTPHVAADYASVELRLNVAGGEGIPLRVETTILDDKNHIVLTRENTQTTMHGQPFVQHFTIEHPRLWSPETPQQYRAVSRIYTADGQLQDTYTTRFGIRSLEFVPDKGFFLNGQHRKFQGVCNHHDLGPLGAAVNRSALIHQLRLLKDMGCDAIRTSHNMPAPELVELCDSLGFMMMIEPFDEWDVAKCENGYHRFFKDWAEKDIVNMVRHYRNSPSVVLWSIGNEVPTQCSPNGYAVARRLQDICHREDPTRKVTCGMDQWDCVLTNGFAAMIDIPGYNYRAHRYQEGYEGLPQGYVLGSETASTVSSRGVYKFPVVKADGKMYPDKQSSSYDVEACWWSNIPDWDFANADDQPWTLGQFVWTGFDYLGEPTPYDTNAWPSHSSYFGIIDLASLPKDRYYLYRSVWNKQASTLHVLPHWTWPGREGQTTPVFVYTNYPEAELFVNGKSQGRLRKADAPKSAPRRTQPEDYKDVEKRYRLMWNEVVYEPGELRVVAYNDRGEQVAEKVVRTAGKPHHLELVRADNEALRANAEDVAYYTVRAVDKDGNLCPADNRLVRFKVSGNARFKATANGDPTCLDAFQEPQMHLFSGMCTVIVQTTNKAGAFTLEAAAAGLQPARAMGKSQ